MKSHATPAPSLAALALLAACSEWGARGQPSPEMALVLPSVEAVWWTDVSTVPPQEQADILFVIDNSGSMGDEQEALAENFPNMLGYLSRGLDYRVAVVTTDPYDLGILHEVGPYSYAHPNQEDPAAVFADLAHVGAQGSWYESGADAAWSAIELRNFEGHEANLQWYRPDAEQLHFVFVSDEDDHSQIYQQAFIDWLKHGFPAHKTVVAHAIVSQPDDDPACTFGFAIGWRYSDYAKETGGVDLSLCDEWSSTLQAIGEAAITFDPEIPLSRNPVVDTITLRVDFGAEVSVCAPEPGRLDVCAEAPAVYRPGRNSVVLLDVPYESWARVEVTYQVEGAWE